MMLGDLPPSSSVALCRCLHHQPPDVRRPREGDLAHLTVPCEGIARARAVTRDNVDDTWGEAGLGDEGGKLEARERGQLRGLEDDGVACGQSRGNFPGEHEKREVPGNDGAADANGFVAREGEGALRVDHLAVDLVGPSGIVAEALDQLGNCFDLRELLSVRLEDVGKLVHEAAAGLAGCLGPDVVVSLCKGAVRTTVTSWTDSSQNSSTVYLLSSVNSEIHIFGASLGNLGDDFTVGRVHSIESLAILGGNELVVDEQTSVHW
ncbi:hypothetical protein BC936DRAFT_146044 [Jimgerdemannia flammicorona]|uniref:Uncharacterized protein n=1 Tax=Jimgerdemannia flammicorona TaxID=994334 RepID=A0A433D8G8_9FUNG|nr:hypothetical protein BC936DRAFT_146044 [Jimgerdemannia flammicorona]